MSKPAPCSVGPVFTTERSAPAALTLVVAVAELFLGTSSVVLLEMVAVLLIVVRSGVFAFTFTTRLKLALAPAANVAIVHVTVPVPPGAGLVQEKDRPAVWVIDTNVVFVGVASPSEAF